jgi:hypothetical protein
VFLQHELQGIIKRRRGLSLCSRKPLAPGFQCGRIKGIGGGPDLYDHRVHPVLLVKVQLADKIGFLLVGASTTGRPVNIIDGGDPYAPEFKLGLCN